VELFCKVIDVEQGQRFRKHGSHTPLHELYAKWSQKWSKRLAGSKGRVLTEVDLCFEALQLKAAKEAAELHGLEVAFDAVAGRPAKAPRKRRREPPVGQPQQAAARVASWRWHLTKRRGDLPRRPAPASGGASRHLLGREPPRGAQLPPTRQGGPLRQGAAHAPCRRRGRAQHLSTCVAK